MTKRSPLGKAGLERIAGRRRQGDVNTVPAPSDKEQALWDAPRARNHINPTDGTLVTDPPTSRAAAESVSLESVTRIQRAILDTLSLAGEPLSDEEICARLKWMRAAESGIRSRRSELLRAGLIEVADSKGLTSHQRPCRRYRIRTERGVA